MVIAGPQATRVHVGLNYFRSLKFKFFLVSSPWPHTYLQGPGPIKGMNDAEYFKQ